MKISSLQTWLGHEVENAELRQTQLSAFDPIPISLGFSCILSRRMSGRIVKFLEVLVNPCFPCFIRQPSYWKIWKRFTSSGKIMPMLFANFRICLLVEFLDCGTTIIEPRYYENWEAQSEQTSWKGIGQRHMHDNVRSQTNNSEGNQILIFGLRNASTHCLLAISTPMPFAISVKLKKVIRGNRLSAVKVK